MTMFQGDLNSISTPMLFLIENRFKAMPNVLNLFTMKWTWRENVINVPNMNIYYFPSSYIIILGLLFVIIMFLHWHLTSYEVKNDVHTSIWTLTNFQLLSPLFTNINFYLCANHLHVYLHLITTYHLPTSPINMTNPLHDMLIITCYPTYPPTKFTHKIYPPQNLFSTRLISAHCPT